MSWKLGRFALFGHLSASNCVESCKCLSIGRMDCQDYWMINLTAMIFREWDLRALREGTVLSLFRKRDNERERSQIPWRFYTRCLSKKQSGVGLEICAKIGALPKLLFRISFPSFSISFRPDSNSAAQTTISERKCWTWQVNKSWTRFGWPFWWETKRIRREFWFIERTDASSED